VAAICRVPAEKALAVSRLTSNATELISAKGPAQEGPFHLHSGFWELGLQPRYAFFDRLQVRIDDIERIARHTEPTGPLLQFAPEPLPMLAHLFQCYAIFEVHQPVHD
jgi:hypothetical protein